MAKIRIMVVEPLKAPREEFVEDKLNVYQELVGGYIECLSPFPEYPRVALICSEEGKFLGLPENRVLFDPYGAPCDIVHGAFFLVGTERDEFRSLTDEEVAFCKEVFCTPVRFMHSPEGILVLPIDSEE